MGAILAERGKDLRRRSKWKTKMAWLTTLVLPMAQYSAPMIVWDKTAEEKVEKLARGIPSISNEKAQALAGYIEDQLDKIIKAPE